MGQPTVCQQLFENLFIVGLPNKFLWTQKHLERVPGLHSDDPDVNRVFLNEVTYVPRTIVAMVMLYDKGMEVQFQDRRDMLVAYDLIKRHLDRWGEIISHPLGGRRPPPADELLMLEDFANYLYADAAFERSTLEAQGMRTESTFLSDFFSMFGGRDSMRNRRRGVIESSDLPFGTQEIGQAPAPQPGSMIQTAWNNSPWSLVNGNSGNTRKP